MYQVPLEMICRHDRTAEVCRAAVEEDGWQLENVPEELKTPELCRKALETEAGFQHSVDHHRAEYIGLPILHHLFAAYVHKTMQTKKGIAYHYSFVLV